MDERPKVVAVIVMPLSTGLSLYETDVDDEDLSSQYQLFILATIEHFTVQSERWKKIILIHFWALIVSFKKPYISTEKKKTTHLRYESQSSSECPPPPIRPKRTHQDKHNDIQSMRERERERGSLSVVWHHDEALST